MLFKNKRDGVGRRKKSKINDEKLYKYRYNGIDFGIILVIRWGVIE